MKRNPLYLISTMAVFFFVFCAGAALAKGPSKAQKAQHADKNNDGTVDKKEIRMEKEWEQEAQKADNWWKKQADANKDGALDPQERSAWKEKSRERADLNGDGAVDAKEQRLSWRHGQSKVNTDLEKRYDANGDGWLEEAEARSMLQDKQTLIATNGKAKVDSAAEAAYDANKDGVIDAAEAQELKGDL